jgi:ribulose-5-phosphate 4-epimerase/fuculose-1-phosphate aldolase
MTVTNLRPNMDHWQGRVDLAAAFRWTARLDMHEAVANHFSLSINEDGTRFLMNPNQMHFARIRASDLIEVDANDPQTLSRPGATRAAPCMSTRSTPRFWRALPTAACRPSTRTAPPSSTAM